MDNMQRANLENPLCQRQAEQAMKKDGKQVRELIKLIFMFILIRDMFYTSQYVRMFYILWYIYIYIYMIIKIFSVALALMLGFCFSKRYPFMCAMLLMCVVCF